jgi:lipopolysaccharide biosynthesis glycosyltransferase
MNSIIVLNYNNVLCNNTRESLLNASERWKCAYTEIQHIEIPSYLYPSFYKINMLINFTNYDQILFLDSDILIRSDAPNIFNIFTDENKFYCVNDISSRYDDNLINRVRNLVHIPYYNVLKEECGFSLSMNDYCSGFFNSGVQLFNVNNFISCLNNFKKYILTEENINKHCGKLINGGRYGWSHHEQALWNFCVRNEKQDLVEYINETWNCIDPYTDKNTMNDYIYHFTGSRNDILKKLIVNYNWRI